MKIFYEFPQFYLMFPNFKMATDAFLQKMTFFFWRLLKDKKISLLINLSNFSFNDKLTSKCAFFTSCLSQALQTPKHYACETHFKLNQTCQLRFFFNKTSKMGFWTFFCSFFFLWIGFLVWIITKNAQKNSIILFVVSQACKNFCVCIMFCRLCFFFFLITLLVCFCERKTFSRMFLKEWGFKALTN